MKIDFKRHPGWRGNYGDKQSLDTMVVYFDDMGRSLVVDIPVTTVGDRAEFQLDGKSALRLAEVIGELMGDRSEVQR